MVTISKRLSSGTVLIADLLIYNTLLRNIGGAYSFDGKLSKELYYFEKNVKQEMVFRVLGFQGFDAFSCIIVHSKLALS